MEEENISSEEPTRQKTATKYLNKKVLLSIFITLMLVVITLIITLISLKIITNKCKSHPLLQGIKLSALPEGTTTEDTSPSRLLFSEPSYLIIERTKWKAQPLLKSTPLHQPIPQVVISHTATPFCKNFTQCSKRVQSIQNYHILKKGFSDFGYNFLVGGDGNIYEGRGWDSQNGYDSNSLYISFIGNYLKDHLTEKMINVTTRLIPNGVENGKLSPSYKLVAHNQTAATQSPGVNLYKVIKTWPHFDPDYKRKNL